METIRQLWNVGQSVYNISGLISSLKKQGETVLDTERPKGYNKPVQCHLCLYPGSKHLKRHLQKRGQLAIFQYRQVMRDINKYCQVGDK